jgi:sugar phosphate isomerase/epimerase
MIPPLKIGISSYTYTWAMGVPGYHVVHPLTTLDLIEKASEQSAKIVQFADNVPLDTFSKEKLAVLVRKAKKKSIKIETGARGLSSKRLEQYIGIAQILQSEILRFVIDENDYQPSPDAVIEVIRPFIPALESANIRLALENHDRLTCDEFAYIIRQCNSPHVGICLDTVNSLGVPEGTREVIRKLLPYTVNLHIKDFNIERLDHKMGFKVEGVPAGKGKLDIPFLLNELRALGKCKTAILELWTPFGPSLEQTIARETEWATESMNYLTQLQY